ncbi:BAR-domain-containing protein, partial [Neolentinus lepideus HHB14362 ss-1]
MASKQLGKLRQWAGEVIAARERTVGDELEAEFKEVGVREEGGRRLHEAAKGFHHALAKKRESEAGLLLPADALGVVMITHGEELGGESVLGTALIQLGRAHCKAATLQEAFALTLEDTFLAAMQRYEDEIKDYQALRKKLESRRLSYDAAISKAEKVKSSKKEKERAEAEDELEKAKSRYEETLEDVRAIVVAIQENEAAQIRDLTSFLDHEMNYIVQYLEVLRDVKDNWVEVPSVTASRAIPSRPRPESRHNSIRSHKSSVTRSSRPPSPDSADEDAETPVAHRRSFVRRKSDAASHKTASRASSRTRSEAETEKEKVHAKKLSVAGWVGSITGRGKGKDREKFAALQDQEGAESDGDEVRSEKSGRSESRFSRRGKRRDAKAGGGRKTVRAVYDFSGASGDELSFRAGAVIVVLSEVLEGWWMGEVNGKTGLFPTTYTDAVGTARVPPVPPRPTPRRASTNGSRSSSSSLSSGAYRTPRGEEEDGYATSDMEDEAMYSGAPVGSARTPVYGSFDQASVESSVDGEEVKLMEGAARKAAAVLNARVKSEPIGASSKRAAPPPPPARRSVHSVSGSSNSVGSGGSPFDSPRDSRFDVSGAGACREFKQNPFKPAGMCSNCFE